MIGTNCLRMLCVLGVLAPAVAGAAEPATTAETLQKVHASNQKEIAMGKQAIDRGASKDVKAFGRALVKDHTAADKKVAKLAKEEGVALTETSSTMDSDMVPAGAGYDAAFAKMMIDDHKRDISEVTAVRDSTSDQKLKKLLTAILPTLQKHQEQAQRIADKTNKS